jgi:transcriptional regulator with XRE-family HTH domain
MSVYFEGTLAEFAARETIGQRLRRLRKAKGLSQRELATEHVSYAYISRIESGARNPSVKALREIAPKLGVSAYELEFGVPDAVYVLMKQDEGGADIVTAFRDEGEAEDWASLLNDPHAGGLADELTRSYEVVFVPINDREVMREFAKEELSEKLSWRVVREEQPEEEAPR